MFLRTLVVEFREGLHIEDMNKVKNLLKEVQSLIYKIINIDIIIYFIIISDFLINLPQTQSLQVRSFHPIE